jgi:hypothetical protein
MLSNRRDNSSIHFDHGYACYRIDLDLHAGGMAGIATCNPSTADRTYIIHEYENMETIGLPNAQTNIEYS